MKSISRCITIQQFIFVKCKCTFDFFTVHRRGSARKSRRFQYSILVKGIECPFYRRRGKHGHDGRFHRRHISRIRGIHNVICIVRITGSVGITGVVSITGIVSVTSIVGIVGVVRITGVTRVIRDTAHVVHGCTVTRLCALSAADGTVMVYGFLRACFGADAHGRFRLPFLGKCRYGE